MFVRSLFVIFLGLFGLFSPAVAGANPPPVTTNATAPLPVVASFSILADLVRQVGGDAVQVTSLVPVGADAHVYQPTPSAIKAVATAELLVVNGLGFEGWLERIQQAAQFHGQLVIASAGLTPLEAAGSDEHGHAHAHDHGAHDPHAWQDPTLVAEYYLNNITNALSRLRPAQATEFASRATTYRAALLAQDAAFRAQLDTVPSAQRQLITSHDALGYFAKAYGIRVLAAQGLSTDSEPSAAQLKRLITQIKQHNIKTIFTESISSPKLLAQLAQDTGAKLGPPLYTDTLSPSTGPAATYLAMLQHNHAAILAALTATTASPTQP